MALNLPTMSYHKVSLSSSLAWIKATKKPTSSRSVISVACGVFTTGGCLDLFRTGTTNTETRQMELFAGLPPSVALTYIKKK